MKKFLFCCVLLVMLCVSKGFTQTIITGTAKDARGETLPGVSVKLKGTSEGVSTNTSGNYSINIPQVNGILVFSFIGMQNQEVEISGRKVIDVTLLESIASLQEVVVVGYGSQSRETVTTSISKLDTKVLANVPFANVASALQGALSGVRVQTTTGMPGAAPRIIIRGGTSINNPDGAGPLYVVDGVIRSNINSIDQSFYDYLVQEIKLELHDLYILYI